jgi:membrane-bound inhibitor of C-type lysozyme
MNRCNKVISGMAVAGMAAGLSAAFAQTFQTYHCADGTQFYVGFYPHDPNAYLQIDGRPVILKKRFALSGARYWGGGLTLRTTGDGRTFVRHAGRRATACQSR